MLPSFVRGQSVVGLPSLVRALFEGMGFATGLYLADVPNVFQDVVPGRRNLFDDFKKFLQRTPFETWKGGTEIHVVLLENFMIAGI
mmetsp:Transcript_67561/g.180552  ORF Transcript_67561/g.180552 Transcript_67561/m.180552 type:complete len:86 (+) Transcript_67561:633-890(+)